MKKILSILFFVMLLTVMGWAPAKTPQSPKIHLYQSAAKGKVIKRYPLNTYVLVPIYRKGAWTKVGDRQTGLVGWVNAGQIAAARKRYIRQLQKQYGQQKSDIQTVFINVDQKHGKKIVNIVAYKNGKKVSDKEAKALYQRMLKYQSIEQGSWSQFDQMMERQQRDMDRLFPIILMPGPVIQQPTPLLKKQPKAYGKNAAGTRAR